MGAVDNIIALRGAAARQYGQDETTRDSNNKVSPFTPHALALALVDEWSSALNVGVTVALYKPNAIMRAYDRGSDELLAKLARVKATVTAHFGALIPSATSALLWDTLVRSAILLDSIGVVPDATTLALEAIDEAVDDLKDALPDLPDLPKFPVIVIGLVALVVLVVLVKP